MEQHGSPKRTTPKVVCKGFLHDKSVEPLKEEFLQIAAEALISSLHSKKLCLARREPKGSRCAVKRLLKKQLSLSEVAAFFALLGFLGEPQNLVDDFNVGEQHAPATVPLNAQVV